MFQPSAKQRKICDFLRPATDAVPAATPQRQDAPVLQVSQRQQKVIAARIRVRVAGRVRSKTHAGPINPFTAIGRAAAAQPEPEEVADQRPIRNEGGYYLYTNFHVR